MSFPTVEGAVFGLITEGECLFRIAGCEPQIARRDDFLFLPSPPEWSLTATGDGHPVEFQTVFAGPAPAVTRLGDATDGPVTRMIGGRFTFGDENAELLRSVLPAMIVIPSGDSDARRLRKVLDLIDDEAAQDRPGRELVLERLLELMLVEAVRQTSGVVTSGRPGLLTALANPRISAALRALHGDHRHPWTVQELAGVAGMSRSVFAERFTRSVGVSPFNYLLKWRMALAKESLRRGENRLTEVAEEVGYQSVSAFSAAFTRTVGCPPSQYATSPG